MGWFVFVGWLINSLFFNYILSALLAALAGRRGLVFSLRCGARPTISWKEMELLLPSLKKRRAIPIQSPIKLKKLIWWDWMEVLRQINSFIFLFINQPSIQFFNYWRNGIDECWFDWKKKKVDWRCLPLHPPSTLHSFPLSAH